MDEGKASAWAAVVVGGVTLLIAILAWQFPQADKMPQPYIGTWNGSIYGFNRIQLDLHEGEVDHEVGTLSVPGCRAAVYLEEVADGRIITEVRVGECRLIPDGTTLRLSLLDGRLSCSLTWRRAPSVQTTFTRQASS